MVNELARRRHAIFKSHNSRRFQDTAISLPHFGKLSWPSLRLFHQISRHFRFTYMHLPLRYSFALSLECVDSLGYYFFCVGVHSVFQGGGYQFFLCISRASKAFSIFSCHFILGVLFGVSYPQWPCKTLGRLDRVRIIKWRGRFDFTLHVAVRAPPAGEKVLDVIVPTLDLRICG